MKKVILFVLIVFVFHSCSKEKPEKEIVESRLVMYIEPYLTFCYKECEPECFGGLCDPPEQRNCVDAECFVTFDEENKQKEIPLKYFNFGEYEKGYRYQVEVLKKEERLNREPYQDEIDVPDKYEVIKILKKTKIE